MKEKTGSCFYRDEEGNLIQATSFQDEDGVVTTEIELIELAVKPEE